MDATGAPQCEMLSFRERVRDAIVHHAARYVTFQVAQIFPEATGMGENCWEPWPDHAKRGIVELENYANFPQLNE